MAEEAVCVGVDVAENTLDLTVSNSNEARQFENDVEGIMGAVSYIELDSSLRLSFSRRQGILRRLRPRHYSPIVYR